jgi:hypothetical protein
MCPSEQSNSNSVNQDTQDDQTLASDSFEVKPEPKPTMSKRDHGRVISTTISMGRIGAYS